MRILLADDDPLTLRLLKNTLRRSHYETVLARDGQKAFHILTHPPVPEVALLDWMLPGLDGIEICRRLRAQKDASFVYIILLISHDRLKNVTAGLDAGANDYMTKPFDKDELKSRIAVGFRVVDYENSRKVANDKLLQYSHDLKHLTQERVQQLVQADRMISLGTMAAGIAHEINNPLTIVQGNIGLLKHFWQQSGQAAYQEVLDHSAAQDIRQPELKEIWEMIENSEKAVKRLRDIVDGMRSFAHGQGGKVTVLDPVDCLRDAVQICLPKTKHLCKVKLELQEVPFQVKANPVQITQVLVNLLSNAADALAGTTRPSITATIGHAKRQLLISLHDNGPGIPPDALDKVWSPSFTTKPVGQGTGLGLSISHKIAEEHYGELRVVSPPGAGTTFTLLLPEGDKYERLLTEQNR